MIKNILVNDIKNSLYLYKLFQRIQKKTQNCLNKKKIINIIDIILALISSKNNKINNILQNCKISKKIILRRLQIINSLLLYSKKNIKVIRYFFTKNISKTKFYVNKEVLEILKLANNLKKDYKNKKILAPHLFLALLKHKNQEFKKIFSPYLLNFEELEKNTESVLKIKRLKNKLAQSSKKNKPNSIPAKTVKNDLPYSLKKYLHRFIRLISICNLSSIKENEIICIKNFVALLKKKTDVSVDLENVLYNLVDAFIYFTNKKNIIKLDPYFQKFEVNKSIIPPQQQGYISPFKIKYNIPWFNKYTIDKFDFFDYGYEVYYTQIFKILLKSSEKNVILVGENGIGKTTLLKKLAKSFLDKKSFIPRVFNDKLILFINSSFLVSQTNSLDELTDSFDQLITISRKEPNLFVFIDDIDLYCKTDRDGTRNLKILEPFILSDIKCIATTNEESFNTYFNSNNLFKSKFEKVNFKEPNLEKTKNILNFLKPKFEKRYKLQISNEIVEKICFYSKEYLIETKFPKNAINLFENACVDTSLIKSNLNVLTSKLRQQIQIFLIKKTNLNLIKDNLELTLIEDKINVYRSLLKLLILSQIRKAFLKPKSQKILGEANLMEALVKFSVSDIAQIFATMNIDVVNLQQELQKKVIGQENAIKTIIGSIKRYKIGLKASNKPIGSFFLAGPTGVGKTEFAKALAKLFYNNENSMLRLDMSEYTNKANVSALIGSPPGYVGFEKGGKLTEFVKTTPYSLILFDEMEKADPAIYDILLQVLDEGRLTDSQGNTVNFSKTFIIFTSNIGVKEIDIYCTSKGGQQTEVIKPNLNKNLINYANSKKQFLYEIILKNNTIGDLLFKAEIKNSIKPKINYNFVDSLPYSKKLINDTIKFIEEKKLLNNKLKKKIKFPTFEQIIITPFDYLINSKKQNKSLKILKDLEIQNYFWILFYLGGKKNIEKSKFSKTIHDEMYTFLNIKIYNIKNIQINVKELKNLLTNLKFTSNISQRAPTKIFKAITTESQFNDEQAHEINANTQNRNLLKIVKGCLFKKFRPEFINRIDEIIVFQRLNLSELKIITLKLLLEFMKNFYNEYKIKLFIDEKFINLIAEIGYNPKYGARPLKRALNEMLSDRLVSFLLNKNLENVNKLFIAIDEDKDFACYTIKKTNNQNELTRIKNCQLQFLSDSLDISKDKTLKYLNTKFTNFVNLPY
jgi:ATP-dependent Clp protease ATP-binding subunit ClpA